MKKIILPIFIFLLACILFSCKKGSPVEETRLASIQVKKFFTDSPPMEIYVNGKLALEFGAGEGSGRLLIGENSGQVKISIRKKGETVSLKDTVLTQAGAGLTLGYLYNEALSINQFAGGDFRHPGADSTAFQITNKFDAGSHKADIYIYRSADGFSYYKENLVDSVKTLPFGRSSAVHTLPFLDSSGRPIIYTCILVDSETRKNDVAQYFIDGGFGAPEDAAGWPLNAGSTVFKPGVLLWIDIKNLPYEENGVTYQFIDLNTLLEY